MSSPRVVVIVQDDGTGLADPNREGRGLRGMRERVQALGGTFDIESSAAGTRLAVSIPVEPSAGVQPSGRAGR